MTFLNYSKNFKGVADVFLHNPERYLPFTQLLDAVMSGKSELSHAHKEMIATYSSYLNSCHYCVSSHSSVLHELKIEEEVIHSLMKGKTNVLDNKLQAMFDFVKQLTLKPGSIIENDIEAIRLAGWSDQAIEDVICVVSTFAFLNRLVDGLGVAGTDEHFQQVGKLVSEHGYKSIATMVQQKLDSLPH